MDGEMQSLEVELLAHAAWMRRLAGHLISDGAGADDVAQEAALAALEHRRLPRRPRAWLSAVVRNAARRLGRAEGRRARREARAARPEALPSAAELAAEAEVQHALVSALLALEEPYRSTLVLRFYRGLEPAEIARRAGVPAATVRSRQLRALALLRARLDARPGGREAWSAALAPLATWTTAGRSGAAAGAAGAVGGLAMGIKVALGCAAAAAALAAAYVGLRGAEKQGPGELLAARAPEAAGIAPPAAPPERSGAGRGLEQPAPAGERIALTTAAAPHAAPEEPAAPEATATLTGTVRDAQTGEPLAGAEIGQAGARSRSDGGYRLSGLPLGERGSFRVRREGYADREASYLLNGPTGELDVALERGFALELLVQDRETALPLAGAELAAGWSGPVLATADAEGRATLRTAVGEQLSLRVSAPGYCTLLWIWSVAAPPAESPVCLPVPRAAALEGRVLDEAGRPLAGAWVYSRCRHERARRHALPEEQGRDPGLLAHAGYDVATEVVSDLAGGYRLPVVPCEEVRAVAVGHPDFPSRELELGAPLAPGETLWLDVSLAPGGVVRGRVSENGAAWPRAEVAWKRADGSFGGSGYADEEGRYELRNVAPGAVSVELLSGPERQAIERCSVAVEAGKVVELDFARTLELASIRGRVTQAGTPLPGIVVAASPRGQTGGGQREFTARTAEDGGYELAVPAGGVFAVRVARRPAARWRGDVPAGATGVDFDLPALGTLRLRLVDAATGEPVRLRQRPVYGLFWRTAGAAAFEDEMPDVDVDGRQDLTVEAGEVDVLAHLPDDGYAQREAAAIRVPSGGESEIVTLELPRALAARLSFAGEGVTPADLRGHLLFLVEEQELGLIEGPFPDLGGVAHHRIDGIAMRIDRPTLMAQLVQVGADGSALVKGLAGGHYHLRVYPDDFVFEPASFGLQAAPEEPLAVRWKRR